MERTIALSGSQVSNRGFRRAVELVKKFRTHPISRLETITRVDLNHLGYVTITLSHGPQVHMGRNPLNRFSLLEKVVPLLESEEREKIDYIDLQYDDIIIKKKKWWR